MITVKLNLKVEKEKKGVKRLRCAAPSIMRSRHDGQLLVVVAGCNEAVSFNQDGTITWSDKHWYEESCEFVRELALGESITITGEANAELI